MAFGVLRRSCGQASCIYNNSAVRRSHRRRASRTLVPLWSLDVLCRRAWCPPHTGWPCPAFRKARGEPRGRRAIAPTSMRRHHPPGFPARDERACRAEISAGRDRRQQARTRRTRQGAQGHGAGKKAFARHALGRQDVVLVQHDMDIVDLFSPRITRTRGRCNRPQAGASTPPSGRPGPVSRILCCGDTISGQAGRSGPKALRAMRMGRAGSSAPWNTTRVRSIRRIARDP